MRRFFAYKWLEGMHDIITNSSDGFTNLEFRIYKFV